MHELDHLLNEISLKLDDTSYSNALYKELRMDIIHG